MEAERRLQAWRLSESSLTALPTAQQLRAYAEWLLAWPAGPGALLFALAARLPYFLRSDFPLNDGGMFVAMSRDILVAHFRLPEFTTYNGELIPFAYPPLGFYLLAGLSRLTGLDPLVLDRYVPLLANLATVIAVAALARQLLGPGLRSLAAPVLFALVPRSYEWLIMGGGLTRSLGLFFAVASVLAAIHMAKTWSLRGSVLCCVLAALALGCHLEEGLFALSSLGLVLIVRGRSVRAVVACALIGLGTIVLTSPWWAMVVARHGFEPFRAASMTSGWSGVDVRLAALGEFLSTPSLVLSLLGALAVLGAALCLVRGDVLLPAWLVAVFVITPRSAPTQAALPLAFLAAIGACDLVLPGLLEAARDAHSRLLGQLGARWQPASAAVPAAALAGCVSLALVGAYWPRVPLDSHSLESLSPGDRAAMAWVASQTPPSDTFLVLSSTSSWEEDFAGEWFPVLAGRPSALTPQGAEWLPDQLHARRVCLFEKIRGVGAQGKSLDDVDTWASDHGVEFSAIYISKANRGSVDWTPLLASAASSPSYTLLLDSPDVAILQRSAPVTTRWAASGPLVVASDCQSLGDQAPDVQQNFEAHYGAMAARGWVMEHERALPLRVGLSDGLARVISRLERFSNV